MIGNDVIDLTLAARESNWERSGFLQKLFTESEQQIIRKSINPETTVWNFWSRKEAAYKIYNRETGIRAFLPLQLECLIESEVRGEVSCQGRIYFTKTKITCDYIETIATTEKRLFQDIYYLENRAGIQKTNGIPNFNSKPVSISHHGRFKSIITL